MLILTIRTDKPLAEIGLFQDHHQLAYYTWEAHRQLAETIHVKIKQILAKTKSDLNQLTGVVVFSGPGSFTGLRIGLTVGNSLINGLQIKGVASRGPSWLETGIDRLLKADDDQQLLPYYGTPVHITQPKK